MKARIKAVWAQAKAWLAWLNEAQGVSSYAYVLVGVAAYETTKSGLVVLLCVTGTILALQASEKTRQAKREALEHSRESVARGREIAAKNKLLLEVSRIFVEKGKKHPQHPEIVEMGRRFERITDSWLKEHPDA